MAEILADELYRRVRELATATLIARHLPPHRKAGGGGRHDFALALAGYLLKSGRLDRETSGRILEAAWDARGYPSERDQAEACSDLKGILRDTADRIDRGERVQGGPTLEGLVPKMPRTLARYWRWREEQVEPDPTLEWDEPVPLPEGLPPVQPFAPGMLPGPLRDWILDISERMQIPPDFCAAGAVVIAGSLIGRKYGIAPKTYDDWLVVLNLWGAVVGRPAMLKSPALAEVMRPLDRLAARAREDHEGAVKDHEIECEIAENEREALRTEMKKAAKNGDRAELENLARRRQETAPPREPTPRRYKSEDPTVEKLCDLLQKNPRGLLVHRDELSGWLRSLDKQGREGDRSLYLESWNGTGSYEVDRIGRGSLYIPALCVSILGGIQPGPLSGYVYGATRDEGGERDDGLLQRFQVLVWPDPPKNWRNVDRWPDTAAKNRAFEVYRKLDDLTAEDFGAVAVDEDSIPAVRFTPEAQEVFDSWREELEHKVRSGKLSPPLEAHLAKYRSLMPSLALIFQVIEYVGGGERGAVGVEAARQAVRWCSYLETHARRLYSSAESPDLAQARVLLGKIEAGEVEDGSTVREVYRGRHWSRLATPEEVSAAAAVLEDYGWIRIESLKTGGRPTQKIRLHPNLRGTA